MATSDPKKPPKKRGPKPETLKLEGKWEEVVAKAIKASPSTTTRGKDAP
jgi:hypothetical protein